MSRGNLTRAARRELGSLHSEIGRLAAERERALRLLRVSRTTTSPSGQRDFWLELVWLTEEYRFSVRRLVRFCATIDAQIHSAPRVVVRSHKRTTRNRADSGA
jgi:hypothetical protein